MAKSTRIIRILTMPSCENCTVSVQEPWTVRHPSRNPGQCDIRPDISVPRRFKRQLPVALRRIPAAAVILLSARPEDCNKLQALKAGTTAGY